jgi:hypothetical protein
VRLGFGARGKTTMRRSRAGTLASPSSVGVWKLEGSRGSRCGLRLETGQTDLIGPPYIEPVRFFPPRPRAGSTFSLRYLTLQALALSKLKQISRCITVSPHLSTTLQHQPKLSKRIKWK